MKTPNIELAELSAADSPAYAALNDTFRALDAIVQLAVTSRTVDNPPEDAVQGDRYIVGSTPTGDWVDHKNHIAYRTASGWVFRTPRKGWVARVIDENVNYYFSGVVWQTVIITAELVSFDSEDSDLVSTTVQDAIVELSSRIDSVEADSGNTGVNITPDAHPSSPTATDDEFEFGSSIDLSGARLTGSPSALPWTVASSTGPYVLNVDKGYLNFSNTSATTGTVWVSQPMSGTFQVLTGGIRIYPTANNQFAGMWVGRGTKQMSLVFDTASGNHVIGVYKWNSFVFSSSAFSTVIDANHQYFWQTSKYFSIQYDGTNVIFGLSFAGPLTTFQVLFSESAATFLGGAPDTIGLVFSDANSSTTIFTASVDWVRRFS